MKKYFGAIVAILLAVSATAFTKLPAPNAGASTSTYYYAGGVYNDANYDVSSNWNKTVLTCSAGPKMCSIVAPDGTGGHPDFSGLPSGGHVRTDHTIISDQTFKN